MAMTKIAWMVLLLAVDTSAATPISAGRWEVRNDLEATILDGRRDDSPTPIFKPASVCLSPENAVKGPGLAFFNPGICRVLESSVDDGRFAYKIECKATESDDTIVTTASGTFTSTSYAGKSVSTQKHDGMRIEMRSRMEAKRIGDC